MTKLVIDIAAVIIALSLCLYLSVITFQGLAIVIEGLATKKAPSRIPFLALCQNIGIACVIGGYTFQTPDLALTGIFLVATALLASSGRVPTLVPAIEVPLLVSGLLSLASHGVIYAIA